MAGKAAGNPKATTKAKRGVRSGQRKARKANRSWAGAALGRGGLLARGVVYLVLAYLVAEIAADGRGGHKASASSQGAFTEVAHQPGGAILVVILAVGFAAYAGWRALQAVAGDTTEDGGEELVKRLGWAGIALVYLALCTNAFEVAFGGGGGNSSPSSFSKDVLSIPIGQFLLALIGTAVVVGGLGLVVWACMQRFRRYLLTRKMPPWLEGAAHVFETFGNATRGLAIAGVGVSFFVAAVVDDAKDSKGLNGELLTLASHPYGVVVLSIAAAGFFAFGLTSAFEANYRDVDANVKTRA